MKHLKRFERFNEEINWKGLAVGAASLLMVGCHNIEVNGESVDSYHGKAKVTNIELHHGSKGKHHLHVFLKGLDGSSIELETHKRTFNIGDTVDVVVVDKMGEIVVEKVNWKGLAVGAASLLMVGCHNIEVNGKEVKSYHGKGVVKEIDIDHSQIVTIKGENGDDIKVMVAVHCDDINNINIRDVVSVNSTDGSDGTIQKLNDY